MVFFANPKYYMILGVVAMLAGIGVFALWHVHALSHWDIRGIHIVEWCRKTLGRYGCSAFYFVGGILLFLKGYLPYREEKRNQQG